MDIYEIILNQRKIAEKLRGYTYKYPISQLLIKQQVKTCYKNNAETLLIYLVVYYANYLVFTFSNFNENIRDSRKF